MPKLTRPILPKGSVPACFVIAALSVAVAFNGTLDGGPVTLLPAGEPVASRALQFNDHPAGGVAVVDARTGILLHHIQPGEGGFIRGALRGFARERRKFALGSDAEFQLSGWENGRLTLEDPATSRIIELTAFGTDNAAAFRRYLETAERG